MTPNKTPFSQSLAFYTETSHARIDWRGRERFRKDYAKTEDCVELYTSTLFIFPIKSIFPKCSNCSKKFLTNRPPITPSPWPFPASWPWLGAWSHGPVPHWRLVSKTRHPLVRPRLAFGGPPVFRDGESPAQKMLGIRENLEVWKTWLFLTNKTLVEQKSSCNFGEKGWLS